MAFSDFKEILAITASFSTVLLFLTGIFTISKITKRKAVGDDSYMPFLTGFLSCSLWLRYGVLIGDSTITLVNTVGSILQISYLFVYVHYSKSKSTLITQQVPAMFLLLLILVYTCWEEDFDILKFRVGIIASGITIAFFAAPLTKLMYVIRVRNVNCLPFPTIVGSFAVSSQWLLYGVILDDLFITVPNCLGCVLSGVQLSLFAIYPTFEESSKYPVLNEVSTSKVFVRSLASSL